MTSFFVSMVCSALLVGGLSWFLSWLLYREKTVTPPTPSHPNLVRNQTIITSAQTITSLAIAQIQSSTVLGAAHIMPSRNADCLPSFAKPDPRQPDTLGWRAWIWAEDAQRLQSPHQNTLWDAESIVVPHWNEGDVVRGVSGIHARLVPKNWRIIGWPDGDGSGGLAEKPMLVTGIVERFGRYVLGTAGWRAEHVVIRELMAPDTKTGLALERAYPDVIVHYPDQIEGDDTCKSVKSSELGKGSRSAPQPLPPSPQVTQSGAHFRAVCQLQSLMDDLPNVSANRTELLEARMHHALGRLCRIWKDAGLESFDGAVGGIRISIGPERIIDD